MSRSRGDIRFTVAYGGAFYRLRRRDWLRFLYALAEGKAPELADYNPEPLPRGFDARELDAREAQRLLELEGVFIEEEKQP